MENLNENFVAKNIYPEADLNKVLQITQTIAKNSHKILIPQVSNIHQWYERKILTLSGLADMVLNSYNHQVNFL